MNECPTCKHIFEGKPEPEAGDVICPHCGDNNCMDYEGNEHEKDLIDLEEYDALEDFEK